MHDVPRSDGEAGSSFGEKNDFLEAPLRRVTEKLGCDDLAFREEKGNTTLESGITGHNVGP